MDFFHISQFQSSKIQQYVEMQWQIDIIVRYGTKERYVGRYEWMWNKIKKQFEIVLGGMGLKGKDVWEGIIEGRCV